MHDVVVVGGGPAGLQAALTLGRVRRSVLLLDSGVYRNARARRMHNVVAHDGTPPEEFRARARAQLAAYDTVEVREVTAESAEHLDGGFRVGLEGGDAARGRLLVLATGMRDELPATPGLADLWGSHVFGCPFCDGHELAGRSIGVLGSGVHAEREARLLARIGSSVTVLTDGAALSEEESERLAAQGVRVRGERVTEVRPAGDTARVLLDGGEPVEVAGLFAAGGAARQAAPFAEQLGLRMLDTGCVAVDDMQLTSLDGVYAAGDLAHRPSLTMPVASVLVAAAAGQVAGAAAAQALLDLAP